MSEERGQSKPAQASSALAAAASQEMRRRAPGAPSGQKSAKRAKKGAPAEAEARGEDVPDFPRFQYDARARLLGGVTGFLVTSVFQREKSATKEAAGLLAQALGGALRFAPVRLSLSGAVFLMLQPESTASAEQPVPCDASAPAVAEPAAAQQKPALDAVDAVQKLLLLFDQGKLVRPKFCQRITPAETTACVSAAALAAAATRCMRNELRRRKLLPAAADVADSAAAGVASPPLRFAVGYKSKCEREGLPRVDAIKALALGVEAAVREVGMKACVDLGNPEVALLVEVLPIQRSADESIEEGTGGGSGSIAVLCAVGSDVFNVKPRLQVRAVAAPAPAGASGGGGGGAVSGKTKK